MNFIWNLILSRIDGIAIVVCSCCCSICCCVVLAQIGGCRCDYWLTAHCWLLSPSLTNILAMPPALLSIALHWEMLSTTDDDYVFRFFFGLLVPGIVVQRSGADTCATNDMKLKSKKKHIKEKHTLGATTRQTLLLLLLFLFLFQLQLQFQFLGFSN